MSLFRANILARYKKMDNQKSFRIEYSLFESFREKSLEPLALFLYEDSWYADVI